jgi:phosphoglycolate phosphatase-like HAD superfamily hydrolase/SAM-dependent methyltransferase
MLVIAHAEADMTRLVLFDIDGTLMRTGGAGLRAFARTAESVFQRPGGTDSLKFHGRTDTSLVREFLQTNGIPDQSWNVRHFLDAYIFFLAFELSAGAGELCPGVRELIAGLRALPEPPVLGVLTGNVRLGAAQKLAAHGLAEEFVTGAFGDDHESRNQLAAIARDRASRLFGRRLAGEEILVIGDTKADIECAHHIGARCFAVATGGQLLPELLEHSPALAAESLDQLSPARVLAAGEHWDRQVDWEALYQAKDTHWDKGEAAPGLVDFLATNTDLPRGTVVVPGCGRGHDARAWARAGFSVTGLDLAPSAVTEARALTPAGLSADFRESDFLTETQPALFDWLFEHTMFCAIPPGRRDEYVMAAARSVRPGGNFLAVNYLQPRDESGPPFGVTIAELQRRFEPHFELQQHWQPKSFASRHGRERMFWWRKHL